MTAAVLRGCSCSNGSRMGWWVGRRNAVRLRALLKPGEDGGCTAIVPALPGCISEAGTRDEALSNIREAVPHIPKQERLAVEEYDDADAARRVVCLDQNELAFPVGWCR